MMIPIVLTGTIIPNTIKVVHRDWKKRRSEYSDAIKYYRKFSKVYFLENSRYDLSHDREFSNDEKFECFKFAPSEEFERGKGYQEFQMLDEFVKNRLNEDCFIKVTGRYIYENFGEIFSFILREKGKYDLVIDAFIRRKIALTGLFYVKKDIYLDQFLSSYLEMNDSKDVWAEHVIYNRLVNIPSRTFFPKTPILNAISGSTGSKHAMSDDSTKVRIRNIERSCLSAVGARRFLL
jgi:hypothetical protein